MIFPLINYETQESILLSFDQIAEKISNETQLKINDSYYRIVDFEFYSFSKNLSDPHTYQNPLQLQRYKLYLHASGLDITFGDGINYLGILLRSVIKLDNQLLTSQIDGPQKVATALISNFYALDLDEKNEIQIQNTKSSQHESIFAPATDLIKTKRFGLTSKPDDDKEDFYKNLQLRYIAVLKKSSGFKQKLKGMEVILAEKVAAEEITASKANEILGYNRIF